MNKLCVIVSFFIFILISINCNPGNDNPGNGNGYQNNPIPTLTSISPNSGVSHIASFTLTATGTDFVTNSKIVFNDIVKQITYVSSTEITCQIDSDDFVVSSLLALSNMGENEILSKTVLVLVRNPGPGGGDSNSLDFKIDTSLTFSDPKNISNRGNATWPAIAVDSSGNIYVAWEADNDIEFSRSKDNGATWSQPVELCPGSYPAIAVDSSGNIYVVGDGNGIEFSHSTDHGKTWRRAVELFKGSYPSIAADSSGNIYVAGERSGVGLGYIGFSHSTDHGKTWSKVLNISNNSNYVSIPVIAVDTAGNIYVVWRGHRRDFTGYGDIYFSCSIDNGATWSQAGNISNNSEISSYAPAIAVDTAGNTYVVWADYTKDKKDIISFIRSKDNGATWSQPVELFPGYRPSIVVDSSGNIYVLGEGDGMGFSYSTDHGKTWRQALNLHGWANPSFAVDSSGNIYVLWNEPRINYPEVTHDIYFTSSIR